MAVSRSRDVRWDAYPTLTRTHTQSALVAQHMHIYSSLPRLAAATNATASNVTVVVPPPQSRALADGEEMVRYMPPSMYTVRTWIPLPAWGKQNCRSFVGQAGLRCFNPPLHLDLALQALQTLAGRIADIEALLLPPRGSSPSEDDAPPFYINSAMEGDCSLCEVDK